MTYPARTMKNALRPFTPPIVAQSWRHFRNRDQSLIDDSHDQISSLPISELSQVFPDIDKVVVNVPVSEIKREYGMLPLNELMTLAAVCKHLQPERVFEIGTFRGSSTLVMAANTSPDTTVFTLDLPPDDATTKFEIEMGNIETTGFLVGERFQDTEYEAKIHQLFGDSALFDFSPYYDLIDVVFVDGNHFYDNVRVDTGTAFRLVSPSGVIIWDDYHPIFGPGVMQALVEVANANICQISGTRLAICRKDR